MKDRTMLQFDYEEVRDRAITGVLGECAGPAGWWSIAIVLDDRALLLRVDDNTDELAVYHEAAPRPKDGWVPVPDIADVIGARLGWCWVGRNYLGYLDMLTLSLSGLEPSLCFVGMASTVKISRIARAA